MILILRGHIRDSFKTKKLYNLIKEIDGTFPDLKIFIHTWNIVANNISWREVIVDNQSVNDEIIYDYFDDLKHLIKHIIIDDDAKIELFGNLCGNINGGRAPIIGWKNYWYGKYKIIDHLYNSHIDESEMIINCRFDIMYNSNTFSETNIIDFLIKNVETDFTKNVFLFDEYKHFGIDNIYIGNILTMYKLTKKFFYELDDILSKNNDTIHQEFLVYRINSSLFN
jgi:F0F1-type ATP synthase delta subunit